jgi:acyl carrier protein
MNYATDIRNYVITNFLFGDGEAFQDDASFIDNGIIDSTGILELVMHLEATYKIKVQPNELLPENLDGVNRVARFLDKKLQAAKV